MSNKKITPVVGMVFKWKDTEGRWWEETIETVDASGIVSKDKCEWSLHEWDSDIKDGNLKIISTPINQLQWIEGAPVECGHYHAKVSGYKEVQTVLIDKIGDLYVVTYDSSCPLISIAKVQCTHHQPIIKPQMP